MRIESAGTLASVLGSSERVHRRGKRYYTRAVCHGGDGPKNLMFCDPEKIGAGIAVTCHSGKCERDTIRHVLQDMTGLTLCRCDDCYKAWKQDTERPKLPPPPLNPPEPPRPLEDMRAELARDLYAASLSTHPYLARKGFPNRRGLVKDSRLIVPMRDSELNLMGAQLIDPEGGKKFIPGTRPLGASYILGNGNGATGRIWYVEGLATGLSVLAAVRRSDAVVVAFTAENLKQVAVNSERGAVIADHDTFKCGPCKFRWDEPYTPYPRCPKCEKKHKQIVLPAGETAARATRLSFWLPPEVGDANDYHMTYGLEALKRELRTGDWHYDRK